MVKIFKNSQLRRILEMRADYPKNYNLKEIKIKIVAINNIKTAH